MLATMFPTTHHRYTALPILGSRVDDFARWLSQCDYRPTSIRVMLGPIGQVDQWLHRHGIHDLTELDAPVLEACWTHWYRRSATLGGLIRALARYLEAEGVFRPPAPTATDTQPTAADGVYGVSRQRPRLGSEHAPRAPAERWRVPRPPGVQRAPRWPWEPECQPGRGLRAPERRAAGARDPAAPCSPPAQLSPFFWLTKASVPPVLTPPSIRHGCIASSSSHVRCLGTPCRRCCSPSTVTPPSASATTPCCC